MYTCMYNKGYNTTLQCKLRVEWHIVNACLLLCSSVTFSRGGSAFLGFLIIGRNMNGQNVGSFSAASGQRTACSVSGVCGCDRHNVLSVSVSSSQLTSFHFTVIHFQCHFVL